MTKRAALDSLEPVAGNGLLHRRLFLTGGAAVAGLTFMTARAAPPETPASMKTPGAPMRAYGERSAHEARVQRTVGATPGAAGTGSSRTPPEALEGIITPSALHFERHHNGVPDIDPAEHRVLIHGLVERPLRYTWQDLQSLPRVRVFADFHCVTRWSRLGNLWEGVSTKEIVSRAGMSSEAAFVIVSGFDEGWTTNLPLKDFLAEDVLIADRHDGRPLTPEHGGPARLIVPRLYAWKSAKWIRRVRFVAHDEPGYWEGLGYHDRGDPWKEERFR